MNIIKAFQTKETNQKNCKHTKTQTTYNTGGYKVRVVCMDCGKLLRYKFKEAKK